SGLLYQILSNVIAGAIFFGISWLIFEPCTRNEVEPGGESVWWNRLRHMGRKGSQRRVWSWPVVWKDFYYVAGGPTTNILKFIAYLVFLGLFLLLIAYGPGGIDAEEVGAVFIWWSVVFLVIESAILVTRVYRDELQKQTWPTLTLVPLSIPELAYHKLAGALLALIPAGLCLGFGLLCVLEDVVDGLGELLSEPVALFSVSYFLLQMALGYHLATWLSIVAKWAIWPLAIFVSGLIVIMGNIMLMSCLAFAMFGGGDSWAGFMVILSMVSFGAVITMHILIGRKLAELAYAE
ncbi:MAG: hypothetical protein KDA80_13865, partial [Planctomycetaceae bacterium]|nr:hypothetical protein [Planctomycetaceae bacterium]